MENSENVDMAITKVKGPKWRQKSWTKSDEK